jgi:hypothetical protein
MADLYFFYYFDSNQFKNVGHTKQILTKRNMFQISPEILIGSKKKYNAANANQEDKANIHKTLWILNQRPPEETQTPVTARRKQLEQGKRKTKQTFIEHFEYWSKHKHQRPPEENNTNIDKKCFKLK